MALTAHDATVLRRAMGINGNSFSEIRELKARLNEEIRISQHRLKTITEMDAEIQRLKRFIARELTEPGDEEDDDGRDHY